MSDHKLSMTRRGFMQASAATSLVLLGGSRKSAAAPTGKPNIVFILADDLGFADVSCYGRRDYQTPNIDRLAVEGLRLTHAYSNSANCSPTRTALITGRYQMRLQCGLYEPLSRGEEKEQGLPPTHATLPSQLKKAGYRTALVGKWHLGGLPKFGPLKSGYDSFFGIMSGGADYFRHQPGGSGEPLVEGEVPVEKHGYLTNIIGERGADTIHSFAKSKDPFFLSLHFTAPHYPWEGPDDEEASKAVKDVEHYDGGSLKIYAEMVKCLDANVGRVMQALEKNKLTNDTIIIFTSDNGGERFSDAWPFLGKKAELLEGGIRIPNIVRWPGQIPAGSVSEQTNISMDWMPTLLAAGGGAADPATPLDGENLLPVYTGKAQPHSRKLFWRLKQGGQRAYRDGNWKYLRIAGNEFLFDLSSDQRERAQQKERHKEIFERMKNEYVAWAGTMLPPLTGSRAFRHGGEEMADRIGVGEEDLPAANGTTPHGATPHGTTSHGRKKK